MAYTNEALGKALEDLTAAYQHFLDKAKDAAMAALSGTVIAQIKQDAKEHIASELAAQKSALEKAIETAKIALRNSAIEADTTLKQAAEAKKSELAALITAAENALNEKRSAVENALNEKGSAVLQEIKTVSEKERLGLEKIKGEIDAAVRDLYEVCPSSAEEKIKTVNIGDFTLKNGIKICVKFTNGNTADAPRLNVNGTIDKPMTMDGQPVYTGCFDAGGVYEFVYDGTNWECLSGVVRTKNFGKSAGYVKYRNGLLIQWGAVAINNTSFSYPLAFTTAAYGAIAVHTNGDYDAYVTKATFGLQNCFAYLGKHGRPFDGSGTYIVIGF